MCNFVSQVSVMEGKWGVHVVRACIFNEYMYVMLE